MVQHQENRIPQKKKKNIKKIEATGSDGFVTDDVRISYFEWNEWNFVHRSNFLNLRV